MREKHASSPYGTAAISAMKDQVAKEVLEINSMPRVY